MGAKICQKSEKYKKKGMLKMMLKFEAKKIEKRNQSTLCRQRVNFWAVRGEGGQT